MVGSVDGSRSVLSDPGVGPDAEATAVRSPLSFDARSRSSGQDVTPAAAGLPLGGDGVHPDLQLEVPFDNVPRSPGSMSTVPRARVAFLPNPQDEPGELAEAARVEKLDRLQEQIAHLTALFEASSTPALAPAVRAEVSPPEQSVRQSQRPAPAPSVSRSLLPSVQQPSESYVSKVTNVMPAADFVPCYDQQYCYKL